MTSLLKLCPGRVSTAALAAFAFTLAGPVSAQQAPIPEPERPAQQMPADSAMPADGTMDNSGTMERSNEEMRMVLEKLMELGAQPVHMLSVEEARTQPTPADAVIAVLEEMGESTEPEAVGAVEDITVPDAAGGSLDARVYWPEGYEAGGEALPVIVYFHGGGWVIAGIDVYDASARALANQADAIVVSSTYRQGPENRFPAAHDDALAVYSHVVETAHEWNGDVERLAVAGESAGGNLALNVAIAARDQALTTPDAILAVYPVASDDLDSESYIENENAVPLGKADIEWFVANYLNSEAEAADPRIDLIEADLAGLPPVTIVSAEIDPLRSEGEMLRDRLEAAGVDVAYQNWEGVVHEFFGMAAVVPEAQEAQDFAGERMRAALGAD